MEGRGRRCRQGLRKVTSRDGKRNPFRLVFRKSIRQPDTAYQEVSGSALRWPLLWWKGCRRIPQPGGPVGGSARVLPRLWLQGGTCIGQRREYNYEKRVWDAVSGRTDSLPRLWVKPQKTGNMLPKALPIETNRDF